MGFSQQAYRIGLPFPSPRDLPDPGIKPVTSAWQVDSLPTEPLGKLSFHFRCLSTHKAAYMHIVVVQSLICVQLFANPWTAACQASLSFTISQSLLKLMSLESVMPSNQLILCCPFSSCPHSFPGSESFPMSQLFASGGWSIGTSASASVLPMTIQDWFPLGLIGLITLLSKGLLRVFSSSTVWKHQFFSAQPSLWSSSHICAWILEKP